MSSARTRSQPSTMRLALGEKSSLLPMGVATMKSLPESLGKSGRESCMAELVGMSCSRNQEDFVRETPFGTPLKESLCKGQGPSSCRAFRCSFVP